MKRLASWCLAATIAATAFSTPAIAQQAAQPGLRSPDVIFVPTPPEVVAAMLKVAKVGPGDVVYDLGSGDGRIPIAAVRDFNAARATGIDIDPQRISEANANLKKSGITGDRVRFLNQDLFTTDISEATVVTLYLLPSLNLKLLPKLKSELKPGTRIVSHSFDMADQWVPDQTLTVEGRSIYFWTVPKR
jgi:cyclopropane fatty-acyl-phospholipid synthase-like methyltransferase